MANHECIICGVKYNACDDCENVKSFKPWRTIACSRPCYEVYLAFIEYREGRMSAERIREVLNRCKENAELFEEGAFDPAHVRPELQAAFDEIMACEGE